ncbi:AtpZ/AtpI family protein [Sulfuricurvum sp.]|uniref:AtpZ/AtpI family protein n=1 Tax=Sulfuricurvum sp. TaxID=2025608 RepID=UPI003BAF0D5E
MEENQEEHKPRIKPIIEGAESLSLGISIVVAILIGVAIGFGLRKLFGIDWLLWIGVVLGIAAAFLNVYKAYSKQYKEFEKLSKDPRYNMGQTVGEDDDED